MEMIRKNIVAVLVLQKIAILNEIYRLGLNNASQFCVRPARNSPQREEVNR